MNRKVLIGILIGLALLALIAVGISVALPHPSPTASPTTSVSPTATSDSSPNGCLGGSNRDNAMLLAAQKAAEHSVVGATEFAAAVARWTLRHPTPTVDEANTAAGVIISSTATPEFKDLGSAVETNQNPSGGAVADGIDFYVSTTPGVWYVDTSSADKVTVSIGTGYVIDGAVSPQLRSSTTYTLVWEAGVWRLQSAALKHTTEELFRIGTPFNEGC